jgi:membrane protease YdiL (CAAX protease family)
MTGLIKPLAASPTLARVAPFVVFLALTYAQGQFGEAARYWFYLAKTVVGGWLLWSLRGALAEMKWAFSWEAVAAGVGVFALWVGLDGLYPTLDQMIQKFLCPELRSAGLESWCPKPAKEGLPWNPFAQFGDGSALAWFFVAVRTLGSAIVVPPLEEVFYRSFLYRYIARPDFEAMPLGKFAGKALVLTAVIFGLAHVEWLPGILCGLAYQGLVIRHGRLGDAMTAHAITNFLLALWVVGKGAWHFW